MSFRQSDNWRYKLGGCGLVHVCPDSKCGKFGCYEHLDILDQNFNFSSLKFAVICKCGYQIDELIAVRSSFQGAIPCFLCSGNSNASLGINDINFMQDFYDQDE